MRLKLIGYWDNRFRKGLVRWPLRATGEYREYPCPLDLVDPAWHQQDLERIVRYLCAGHKVYSSLGYSSCRFRCGIPDKKMGDSELTDGSWVWPEGLPHYLEHHHVMLPEEFVAHVVENRYAIPPRVVIPAMATGEKVFDDELWVRWGRTGAKHGFAGTVPVW